MNWMNEISNVLQNYSGGSTGDTAAVESHFGQVAQAAPASAVADGLAAMFKSNQTPAFGQMIGQLFSNSDSTQRANLLNTLLSSGAGASILAQLAQNAGVSLPTTPGTAAITPETASQISPAAVEQAAAHAEQHDPSIVDRVSQLYAQHPTLVKTLGAAALGIALSHLANRRS